MIKVFYACSKIFSHSFFIKIFFKTNRECMKRYTEAIGRFVLLLKFIAKWSQVVLTKSFFVLFYNYLLNKCFENLEFVCDEALYSSYENVSKHERENLKQICYISIQLWEKKISRWWKISRTSNSTHTIYFSQQIFRYSSNIK